MHFCVASAEQTHCGNLTKRSSGSPMKFFRGFSASAKIICALFCALEAAPAWCAEKSAKLTPVRIGIVSRSTLDLPFWVARERGFFRDEGLDAEIILMRSNLTLQAMLAGSLDFGTATGAAINGIVNGADLRVVFAMSDKPAFELFAQPQITSLQQLRGKKIGVGGVGSLSEVILRQILSVQQIPADQVTFLALGQNSLTYTSLKAKIIDATMLQVPQNFLAQDEGFRKLAAAADFYRVVQGGLATAKATITEHPELVSKTIRATLRGLRVLKSERKYAVDLMKGPYLDFGTERERLSERFYDAAVQAYLMTGIVDDKLQREMIATASQRSKAPQPLAPERVFDFSFARKAGGSKE